MVAWWAETSSWHLQARFKTALEAAQYRALMIKLGCPEPKPAQRKHRMTALEGELQPLTCHVSCMPARVLTRSCACSFAAAMADANITVTVRKNKKEVYHYTSSSTARAAERPSALS